MQKSQMRVGVFDSGIGGLTVLAQCVALMPQVSFYYLGDNFRAPYGNRGKEEITRFVGEAMDAFVALGVDAVVLACNTATAVCAEEMRARYSFPIVGIEPAVRVAARTCKSALVLSTPRTAESDRLRRLLFENPNCAFTVRAMPDLARHIERSLLHGESFDLRAELPSAGDCEGVVLGCTHYVFFAEEIAAFYQKPVFHGNLGTARRLASLVCPEKQLDLGEKYHFSPRAKNEQTYGKIKAKNNLSIEFLGKAAILNKNLFFRTFVL